MHYRTHGSLPRPDYQQGYFESFSEFLPKLQAQNGEFFKSVAPVGTTWRTRLQRKLTEKEMMYEEIDMKCFLEEDKKDIIAS